MKWGGAAATALEVVLVVQLLQLGCLSHPRLVQMGRSRLALQQMLGGLGDFFEWVHQQLTS